MPGTRKDICSQTCFSARICYNGLKYLQMNTIDLQPDTKQEQSLSKPCFSCKDEKHCSDFDEECAFVKNNLACFFGKNMKDGNTIYVR